LICIVIRISARGQKDQHPTKRPEQKPAHGQSWPKGISIVHAQAKFLFGVTAGKFMIVVKSG
jgi:hypothetical protein